MYLQTRKIEFVKEFLKLQSEEIVTLLENILKKQTVTAASEDFTPMTITELNSRIDKSENGRYSTSQELLSKYK